MSKNFQKKDLVIIPGARHLILSKGIIKNVYMYLRSYFKLQSNPDNSYKKLINRLSKDYNQIYFIDYKRRVNDIFKLHNINLIEETLKIINGPYDVVCLSFGGYLMQKVLINNKVKNLPEKLILVSSININKKIVFPKNIKVVNIYSKSDDFAKKITFLLSGFNGGQHLSNVDNIIVDHMTHSELELDVKIPFGKYKGWTGFKLLERVLLGTN